MAGDGGLTAVTERIGALIKEHRPAIIAIDSFKALAAFADDARGFRRFLHELAALLTVFPATSLWLGEYSEDESRTAPEFAVVDGIISLATERASQRTLRLIAPPTGSRADRNPRDEAFRAVASPVHRCSPLHKRRRSSNL